MHSSIENILWNGYFFTFLVKKKLMYTKLHVALFRDNISISGLSKSYSVNDFFTPKGKIWKEKSEILKDKSKDLLFDANKCQQEKYLKKKIST